VRKFVGRRQILKGGEEIFWIKTNLELREFFGEEKNFGGEKVANKSKFKGTGKIVYKAGLAAVLVFKALPGKRFLLHHLEEHPVIFRTN
jgi:hypothetical protein